MWLWGIVGIFDVDVVCYYVSKVLDLFICVYVFWCVWWISVWVCLVGWLFVDVWWVIVGYVIVGCWFCCGFGVLVWCFVVLWGSGVWWLMVCVCWCRLLICLIGDFCDVIWIGWVGYFMLVWKIVCCWVGCCVGVVCCIVDVWW